MSGKLPKILGLFDKEITEKDIDYLFSGEFFRKLNDEDKEFLMDNPDVCTMIPLLSKSNLDTINQII